MSSTSLKKLAERYPDEAKTLNRLSEFLTSKANLGKEYTFDRLSTLLEPNSRNELALILAELVKDKRIRFIIRIESPSRGGGIADYDDVQDVPRQIHDWRADRDIEVTPENLIALYSPLKRR